MINMKTEINLENTLESCSFVKMILMLCVVLYHSCVYWTGNWFDNAPIRDSLALSFFRNG